jgi:hypothetical protein
MGRKAVAPVVFSPKRVSCALSCLFQPYRQPSAAAPTHLTQIPSPATQPTIDAPSNIMPASEPRVVSNIDLNKYMSPLPLRRHPKVDRS